MFLARRFTINPVALILALIFWYWMWGVTGAILAVPLLAITKIICDDLRPLRALGHSAGGLAGLPLCCASSARPILRTMQRCNRTAVNKRPGVYEPQGLLPRQQDPSAATIKSLRHQTLPPSRGRSILEGYA